MRKPSTYSLKHEEDGSDSFSTSAPASTQAYLDDNISPQNSYNKEQSEDSDCFSDSSKKIRKKRNAYSKISDEIRCKLLECVKNGETLKSAAKRFKINYSSAKSILHTFRKEGRILKKSAQERTMKKKPESMIDVEHSSKSSRLKKTAIQVEKEKTSKSLTNLASREVYSKESTPVGSLSRLDEGSHEQTHYGGMDQEVNGQARKTSYYHDDHQYNKMNYYMNYNDSMTHHHPEVNRNYMLTEGMEHQGHYGMHYPREYESYDMSNLHHRPTHAEEYFSDPTAAFLHQREVNAHHHHHPMEDRFLKPEHGEYDHAENAFNPLKSFMDTQSVFRDALRKANNVSYSNSNNTGFRKSSIDLF